VFRTQHLCLSVTLATLTLTCTAPNCCANASESSKGGVNLQLKWCRAILERLPEGDEDEEEMWSSTTKQAMEDEAADDDGDDGGE